MRKRLTIFSVLFLCMFLVSSGAWAVRGYPGNFIHKGPSGHDVTGYGAKGDGSTNDSAAFTAAIAAGAGNRVIVPEAATSYKLSTNVTVPAGVTIIFQQGGLLSIDSGKTLTINGKIEAGIGQIFSGAGTAVFAKGSCDEVYPEWWGALGDNSTDCTAAFNSAMIAGQTVGVVKVSTGEYRIASPLRQWPVATFSTMQGGMILKGNGTKSELHYTGSTDYCIEVIDPAGSSSPVAATIEDIHMSAPNIAHPDNGGCIGIGASLTSISRVTIDDANTATGIFCGLGSGQSIQTIINDCGFYGSSRIGRAFWLDGVAPILYINNTFVGCKDGIKADNGAHVTTNGLYIFATGTPIWMDDSSLYMSNSWIEGGDTDCFLGGPRSIYKITNTVIGATLFDYESGVELDFDNNQRTLINTEDDAAVVPDFAAYKIFSAVFNNVWEDGGASVALAADAAALNGTAIQISARDGTTTYTGLKMRPSNASEYYVSLPRGTYRWTVYMKDSDQLADDCGVYTRLYDGSWTDTLHERITLTSSYKPYTFLMVMDEATVNGARFHGCGLRVWRLTAGTNTISVSHAILEYLGPDDPNMGDLIAYSSEMSSANGSRSSSVYFYGIQAGKESSPLAQLTARHDGTSDDAKGKFNLRLNDGDDAAGALTTAMSADEDGVAFNGDLTISGDDLKMGTNTDTFLLVADGTEYSPVEMTGDVTITNAGVTAIGADKVTEADLKEVSGTPADEDILTYENTAGDFEWHTLKEIGVNQGLTDEVTLDFYPASYPDGADNTGTVTFPHDNTNHRNFWRWSSGSANQDIDLVWSFRLPPNFSAWTASTAFFVDVRSNDYANHVLTATLYDGSGSVDAGINGASVIPTANDTWESKSDLPTTAGAAGEWWHLHVHCDIDTAADTIDVSRIYFTYLATN